MDFNQIAKVTKYERKEELLTKIKKIIEDFCRDRKLIVYGGLAMDRYLKDLGHSGIYDNYETVDYDTYSLNYLQDSEDLAKILHESGVTYIKVHSGFKPTTRKIHLTILSTSVIDINEVTPEKYEILNPTRLKDGLYYIRSDAFFEDQIKNLVTNLYIDYYRIPKIIKRLELLFKYFQPYGELLKKPSFEYEIPDKYLEISGIWAGDFAFSHYYDGGSSPKGTPILYTDNKETIEKASEFPFMIFPMEGVTIYKPIDVNDRKIMIAPPALQLYFYFKQKINENTSKYDFQIWFLTKDGFPYPNYKDSYLYHPDKLEEKRYEYIKSIHLR